MWDETALATLDESVSKSTLSHLLAIANPTASLTAKDSPRRALLHLHFNRWVSDFCRWCWFQHLSVIRSLEVESVLIFKVGGIGYGCPYSWTICWRCGLFPSLYKDIFSSLPITTSSQDSQLFFPDQSEFLPPHTAIQLPNLPACHCSWDTSSQATNPWSCQNLPL